MNHAGRNGLQRYFRERFANITKDCIMRYLNTCINCPRTKRAGHLIGMRRQNYSPTSSFAALNSGKVYSSDMFDTTGDTEDFDNEKFELSDSLNSNNLSNIINSKLDFSLSNSCNSNNASINTSIISTTPLTMPLFNNEPEKSTNCLKRTFDKSTLNSNDNDERFTRGQV